MFRIGHEHKRKCRRQINVRIFPVKIYNKRTVVLISRMLVKIGYQYLIYMPENR